MQRSTISTFDRRFNWVAAVFLGVTGVFDAAGGAMNGNTGEAVYGFGKLLCAVFFLLHAWQPARMQNPGGNRLALTLLYVGLAISIFGFLLKRGIL